MKKLLLSFLIFFVVAEAIAFLTVGTEDQVAFISWTIPSALLAAFLSAGLSRLSEKWSRIPAYSTSIVAGGLFGFVWTYFVALFLGPWVGAFGAPILLCWIAGGAAASFGHRFLLDHTLTRAIPGIAAFSIAVSLAVFLIPVLVRIAANDQQILTFVFRYVSGEESLVIDEEPILWSHEERLTEKEREILKERYRTGHLDLSTRGSNGFGPQSRAIIVIERPLDGDVRLPQPDRCTVFYFQTRSGFDSFPQDVKLLERFITLGNREYESEGTEYVALSYMIDSWDGGATGSDVMIRWKKQDLE